MVCIRFLSSIIAVLALVACSQSGETSQAPAPVKAASTQEETNWTVIPEESHIRFSAEQQGKKFEGEFSEFEASILFFPDNLQDSKVWVSIPISSVNANDKDRNETLPGKAWFSAKSFPEAVFQSETISELEDGSYIAAGTLSMKGIEHDFDLPFRLSLNETAVMNSEVVLDRTQWNIGEDPWNTDEWVSQSVVLSIQVTAVQ